MIQKWNLKSQLAYTSYRTSQLRLLYVWTVYFSLLRWRKNQTLYNNPAYFFTLRIGWIIMFLLTKSIYQFFYNDKLNLIAILFN